jgi:hypothetical protein
MTIKLSMVASMGNMVISEDQRVFAGERDFQVESVKSKGVLTSSQKRRQLLPRHTGDRRDC